MGRRGRGEGEKGIARTQSRRGSSMGGGGVARTGVRGTGETHHTGPCFYCGSVHKLQVARPGRVLHIQVWVGVAYAGEGRGHMERRKSRSQGVVQTRSFPVNGLLACRICYHIVRVRATLPARPLYIPAPPHRPRRHADTTCHPASLPPAPAPAPTHTCLGRAARVWPRTSPLPGAP